MPFDAAHLDYWLTLACLAGGCVFFGIWAARLDDALSQEQQSNAFWRQLARQWRDESAMLRARLPAIERAEAWRVAATDARRVLRQIADKVQDELGREMLEEFPFCFDEPLALPDGTDGHDHHEGQESCPERNEKPPASEPASPPGSPPASDGPTPTESGVKLVNIGPWKFPPRRLLTPEEQMERMRRLASRTLLMRTMLSPPSQLTVDLLPPRPGP